MVKKIRWTIQKKFIIGFTVLFLLATIIFYQIIVVNLERNTMEKVEDDLNKVMLLTTEFIRQIKDANMDNKNIIVDFSTEIASKLGQLNGQSVALYNKDGQFLYEYIPVTSSILMKQIKYEEDLKKDERINVAFNNKSIYQIEKVENGSILTFIFPIYIYGEQLGVIRYTSDFTNIIDQNNEFIRSIFYLTIGLFGGVLLISWILINKITGPLAILNKATKKVVAGSYEEIIRIHSRDEVGELAKSFNEMQNSIHQVINQLKLDKQKIEDLEKERTKFFQHITHELKTPLTTISGYAQIIGEDDFEDKDFLKKAAERIDDESKRLHGLVTTILDQTRKSNVTVSTFDLKELLLQIVNDYEPILKTKEMDVQLNVNTFMINGSQDEWRQIIINLLDNAWKYSVDKTTIAITLKDSLIIKNRILGLEEKIKDGLFEPFNHSNRQNSHGLGLYIVKQLVEKNHMRISASVDENIFMIKIDLKYFGNN